LHRLLRVFYEAGSVKGRDLLLSGDGPRSADGVHPSIQLPESPAGGVTPFGPIQLFQTARAHSLDGLAYAAPRHGPAHVAGRLFFSIHARTLNRRSFTVSSLSFVALSLLELKPTSSSRGEGTTPFPPASPLPSLHIAHNLTSSRRATGPQSPSFFAGANPALTPRTPSRIHQGLRIPTSSPAPAASAKHPLPSRLMSLTVHLPGLEPLGRQPRIASHLSATLEPLGVFNQPTTAFGQSRSHRRRRLSMLHPRVGLAHSHPASSPPVAGAPPSDADAPGPPAASPATNSSPPHSYQSFASSAVLDPRRRPGLLSRASPALPVQHAAIRFLIAVRASTRLLTIADQTPSMPHRLAGNAPASPPRWRQPPQLQRIVPPVALAFHLPPPATAPSLGVHHLQPLAPASGHKSRTTRQRADLDYPRSAAVLTIRS